MKHIGTSRVSACRPLSRGGWVEPGRHDFSRSLVPILDTGGLIWEHESTPQTK